MSDLVITTPKPILGDTITAGTSSQIMPGACAPFQAAMDPHSPDDGYSIVHEPMRPNARPIFTADPLAFKRDRKSSTISLVIHIVVIFVILSLALKTRIVVALQPTATVTPLDFKLSVPAMILPVAKAGGGGGGGAHEMVEPIKEHLPTIVELPAIAQQTIRFDRAKLAIEPTTQVKMPEGDSLPAFGIPQSQQILLASQGKGSGSGLGQGLGGGIGAGRGSGAGSASGGLMSVGGGVSAPVVIYSVEPEFTEDARQANFQGSVSIKLIVDSEGNPQDVQLVRHLGMGLDEKAIDAVRQYRFKPAMYQGHPVSVQIVIDIDFHLH
jgi:periplasmic protein TonB